MLFRSHGDGQADARVNGYLPEGGDLEQQVVIVHSSNSSDST